MQFIIDRSVMSVVFGRSARVRHVSEGWTVRSIAVSHLIVSLETLPVRVKLLQTVLAHAHDAAWCMIADDPWV